MAHTPAAFLEAALHVPTGIEVEFDVGDEPIEFEEDCDCGRPCCSGVYTEYRSPIDDYADQAGGEPPGWEAGNDCGLAECRSARPTPLGRQGDLLESLRSFLGYVGNYQMDTDNSFHVHVNANPHVGPHVTHAAFLRAYLEHREQMRDLCADPERIESDWCMPVETPCDHLRRIDGVPAGTKYRELNADRDFGSIEIRLWDATDDAELHEARLDLLQQVIGRALYYDADAHQLYEEALHG